MCVCVGGGGGGGYCRRGHDKVSDGMEFVSTYKVSDAGWSLFPRTRCLTGWSLFPRTRCLTGWSLFPRIRCLTGWSLFPRILKVSDGMEFVSTYKRSLSMAVLGLDVGSQKSLSPFITRGRAQLTRWDTQMCKRSARCCGPVPVITECQRQESFAAISF